MSKKVKILVRTPLSPFSGYGMDGLSMVAAMERAGLDVYLQPVHVDPPLPVHVTNLLQKELEAPFDIVLVHQDPGAFDLSKEAKFASKVSAVWTMWEFSAIDSLEPASRRRNLPKRFSSFDLAIGYDKVTTDGIAEYLPKRGNKPKLAVLQGGYEPRDWNHVERDWFEGFNICMLGQLSIRKDPFVLIQAFQELKAEGQLEYAKLHLKNNIKTLHPLLSQMNPDIHIYYETWPTEKVKDFYSKMHMMVAPSRGEGKNLPCLEFQSMGGVVAATNWGGMANWLNPAYSFPLDFDLQPSHGGKYPRSMNARVRKEHLKEVMVYAYNNRTEMKLKGKIASEVIPQICSWDTVIDKFMLEIKNLNQNGLEVYGKWKMSQFGPDNSA